MNAPPSTRGAKYLSAAAALAAATDLALAETTVPPASASTPTETKESTALTRATITLRGDDNEALGRIGDFLRSHDPGTPLPRAFLVQVAIRSARIGPELLKIAETIRAQDARGKRTS